MYPVQWWLTGQLKQSATAQRRADLLPLWAGQSAALIRHERACDLMQSLIAQTSRLLGDPASS